MLLQSLCVFGLSNYLQTRLSLIVNFLSWISIKSHRWVPTYHIVWSQKIPPIPGFARNGFPNWFIQPFLSTGLSADDLNFERCHRWNWPSWSTTTPWKPSFSREDSWCDCHKRPWRMQVWHWKRAIVATIPNFIACGTRVQCRLRTKRNRT